MDRKFLSHPFDMSEYIRGQRCVVGGLDLKLDEEEPEEEKPKLPVIPHREAEPE